MRVKGALASFLTTLTVGVCIGLAPSIMLWLFPSFSKEEAEVKIGRRVRHRHTEKFVLMKCPAKGFCKRVHDGETGSVTSIEPVPDGGYFLVVRWDEPRESEIYLSYFGRYTHRESLIEE